MAMSGIELESAFPALTGHTPLRWQRRLFDQLRSDCIPQVCDLPTGLGKTSVIPIWTIALACQALEGPITLPRRLIYVVNRRTVVDQATSVVKLIRQRLLAPGDQPWCEHAETLQTLARALKTLASTHEQACPLAVSTLRGELADNGEWKTDPSRPAIVIGTIDMIGSKLLFSGYGDGKYWRAQHAGLVGQDSLIVHDEAHLTPSFSHLLWGVVEHQRGELRPVRVMELSATARVASGDILRLEAEDENDEVVRDRLDARKRLYLHDLPVAGTKRVAGEHLVRKLVELGASHDDAGAKVLMYVRSPEDAQRVMAGLVGRLGAKAKPRIVLLTGTIRGHERDRLVDTNVVYRAMLNPEAHVERTVYLVSTSAGEVGIDLDADRIVCDLSTLDAMIQRLGRVNRRGGQARRAQVDVVLPIGPSDAKDGQTELDRAVAATGDVLRTWAGLANGVIDVSPRNLRALLETLDDEKRRQAFAPSAATPPLTEVLLDAWSLTSIDREMSGRPAVAEYLHGLTKDPPETYVAWRKEVAPLHEAGVDGETLAVWFEACPIEARERLRDGTDRVLEKLKALLDNHRKKDHSRDFAVVLLGERGDAEKSSLSRIVNSNDRRSLAYRTIVLPVEAGGLSPDGALDATALDGGADVAEFTAHGDREVRRERWLVIEAASGTRYRRLVTGQTADLLPPGLRVQARVSLEQPPEGAEEDGQYRYLLVVANPDQAALEHAETVRMRQTLGEHERQIVAHVQRIAGSFCLGDGIIEALAKAAERHDRGKNRPLWQWYACNPNTDEPVAKSMRYRDGRDLAGYRHELGSLLEAATEEQIAQCGEADLVLHLIATHHGWARPHFGPKAWDNTRTTSENEDACGETMRRFGRLQQRFGRWGLAWLEALLRCADIAASRPSLSSVEPVSEHDRVTI